MFSSRYLYTGPAPPSALQLAAVTVGRFVGADAFDDIILSGNSSLLLVFAGSSGGFGAPTNVCNLGPCELSYNPLATADVTGDGYDDLVYCSPEAAYSAVRYRSNTDLGGASVLVGDTSDGPCGSIRLGDVDVDGKTDIVILTGGITLFTGSPAWAEEVISAVSSTDIIAIELGNLNNDALVDIVGLSESAPYDLFTLLNVDGAFPLRRDVAVDFITTATVSSSCLRVAQFIPGQPASIVVTYASGLATTVVVFTPQNLSALQYSSALQSWSFTPPPIVGLAVGLLNNDTLPDIGFLAGGMAWVGIQGPPANAGPCNVSQIMFTTPPGNMTCVAAGAFNTTCTMTCPANFTLAGPADRLCRADATWSDASTPLCSSVSAINSLVFVPYSLIAGGPSVAWVLTRDIQSNPVTSRGADVIKLSNVIDTADGSPFAGAQLSFRAFVLGNYTFDLLIFQDGCYSFAFLLNGQPIAGILSHLVCVSVAPVSGPRSVLLNASTIFDGAAVGLSIAGKVLLRDAFDNVVAANLSSLALARGELKNNFGDAFSVQFTLSSTLLAFSFTPQLGGVFTLSINVAGEPILNSPFIIAIDPNCQPGSFAGDSSASTCTLCPPNTYTNETRARTCTPCYDQSVSRAGSIIRRNCTCIAGTYWPAEIRADPASEPSLCLPCPTGGVCAGGDAGPVSLPGWAPARGNVDSFVRCPNSEACVGNNGCARGYRGELCADCAKRYYKVASSCYACSNGLLAVVVVVAIVLIFAFAVSMVIINAKKHRIFGMAR